MSSMLDPGKSSRVTSWAVLVTAVIWFVVSFAALDVMPWWNLVAALCLLELATSYVMAVQVIMPMRHPERAERPDHEAVTARWRDPRRHERLARFSAGFAVVCGVLVVGAVILDPLRWWSWSPFLVMGVSSGFQAREHVRHAARLRSEQGDGG